MKTVLSEIDVNNIINEYLTTDVSVDKLAFKYKVGKIKIRGLLTDNNIERKKKGGQIKHNSTEFILNNKTIKYKPNEKDLIIICKKTKEVFKDVNNLSGCLTQHIKDNYINPWIPSNTYQRKKYEIEHNKKWFEEYFDIIEREKKEIKKCFYCDWVTTDVNNMSGQYQVHLEVVHNISIEEHINNNSDDINYFKNYKKNVKRIEKLNIPNNSVICEICGKKFSYLTDTHLKKHKITLGEYKLKYPHSKVLSNDYINKLQNTYEKGLKHYESKYTTKPHKELIVFLNDLNVKTKSNDKKILKGVEIDVLLEDYKLGIEYNGLYYHNEANGKDRSYHLTKTNLMNSNGYKFIHIFEDEWL